MNYKQIIRHNFNRSAINYDKYNIIQRKIADKLFACHLNKISVKDIILDAGCGTGYVNELIRENKLKNRVYQLDLAYNMCKIAGKYSLSNSYILNADVEFIPLKAASIDLIISSLALQWTNIEIVLNGFRRILNDRGKIMISLFNQNSLNELAQSFKILDNSKRIIDLPKTTDISKMLENLNYKNIEISNYRIINYHKTSLELMKQIKSIGASINRNRNYLTRGMLKNLELIYFKNFAVNNQLPATWEYSIIYAKK